MFKNKCIRIIEKFLRKKFTYGFDEQRQVFTLDVDFGDGVGSMDIFIALERDMVSCVAVFPFHGSSATAPQLAELVCRVNLHLSVGHLDYNFDNGEVRYAYDLTASQLQAEKTEALDRFFGATHCLGKRYVPAIAQLAMGMGDPKELSQMPRPQAEPEKESPPSKAEAPVASTAEPGMTQQAKPEFEKDVQPSAPKKEKDGLEKSDDQVPVPVRNYSLEGLHVKGDFPIVKVESAAQKFLSILNDSAEVLPDRPGFNVLLWGPPGTGKSEFVNYLGQKLGRKVMVRMGSDILSRYVGDTEKSICEAFDEAEEENAILFLDELDGVMQNRAGATAGWEVSQVNELLHQMEHFHGIMIGATNFRDNLDPAVLRRFTYKLQFDYLDDAGKAIFFNRAFQTPLSENEKAWLDRIPNLTPGDFRTVSQSLFYLDDGADNNTRLSALEKESEMKKLGRPACLGFAA